MAAKNSLGAICFGSTSSSTMAASLPPSSSVRRLSVCAALAMTLRPVVVEPVKATLATSGWLVSAAAQIVGVGDHVDHAGGKISAHSSPTFSEVSGVVGAGLTTTVLPASSAGRELGRHHDHREVPRRDRRHHAQRTALADDLRLRVFGEHRIGQVQPGQSADIGAGRHQLEEGAAQRLALLLGQQRGQFRRLGIDGVGQLHQQGAALGQGSRRPGRICTLGRSDRLVELLDVRARTFGHHLFGGRIDDVEGGGAGDELAADEQAVVGDLAGLKLGVHVESPGEIGTCPSPGRLAVPASRPRESKVRQQARGYKATDPIYCATPFFITGLQCAATIAARSTKRSPVRR